MRFSVSLLIALGLAVPCIAEASAPHILKRHQWGADESLLYHNDVQKDEVLELRKAERKAKKKVTNTKDE